MTEKPIRIFIVDDHPVVNRGLTALLDKPESGLKVVGCAFSGKEAVDRIDAQDVDVVLMDIRLPEMNGIEATRLLKSANGTKLKIIILTTFNDRDNITSAIKAGADGFLLKESSEEAIVSSIRSMAEGHVLIAPEAARILAGGEGSEETSDPARASRQKLEQLSQREQEVFLLLTSGKDNVEIAEELCISEHTVRNYVSNIYAVLGLKNRAAAIIWAQKSGLV